jgi:undecaprenyl-diphosphatase
MPTMAGAFAYDLMKNYGQLGGSHWLIVAVGFVTSFVAAWIVVRTLLDYVSSHGFSLFAWWRIVVGALGLIGLALIK